MNKTSHIQKAYSLRNSIRKNPQQKTSLLLQMADSYIAGEAFSQAAMVCRAILKLEPMNIRAMVRMGKSQLGMKMPAKALKTFQTINEILPELEEALWGQWAALKLEDNYYGAIQPLEKLHSPNPNNERILLALVDAAEKVDDTKRAQKYLKTLVDSDPKNYGKLSLKLAELLAREGALASSLSYLDRYIVSHPQDINALRVAARVAGKLKNWELSARYSTILIENSSFSAENMYLLGLAKLEQGKYDEAILVLERLVEKLPEPLKYRMTLAEAFFKNKELESAHREFSRCLVRHPQRDDIALRLGEIAWKTGKAEQAARLYDRVLKSNPSMALALFRLGYIKFDKGLYPAAISLFRRLLVVSPDNFLGNLHLGQALRLTGDYKKARTYLTRTIELVPKLAKPEYEMGLLYKTLQKLTLAREHFQNALRKDPDGPCGKDALYELSQLEKSQEKFLQLAQMPVAVNHGTLVAPPLKKEEPGKAKVKWLKLA